MLGNHAACAPQSAADGIDNGCVGHPLSFTSHVWRLISAFGTQQLASAEQHPCPRRLSLAPQCANQTAIAHRQQAGTVHGFAAACLAGVALLLE